MNNARIGVICLCAMRYSLGRQTYMPGLVQEYIKAHIREIETRDLHIMIRDIDEADRVTEHKLSDGSILIIDGLGDPKIDRPGWLLFREHLKEEINRRVSNGE